MSLVIVDRKAAYIILIKKMFSALHEEIKRLKPDEINGSPEIRSEFNSLYDKLINEFGRFEGSGLEHELSTSNTEEGEFRVAQIYADLLQAISYFNVQMNMPPVEQLIKYSNLRVYDPNKLDPVEDIIDPEQEFICNSNEGKENYWLLTDDGYLEFHGGGYLKYNGDYIYHPKKDKGEYTPVGKKGIESGLIQILNLNEPDKYDQEMAIRMMLDAGLQYYKVENKDGESNQDEFDLNSLYWNVKENLDSRETRRIKLDEALYQNLIENYCHTGWEMVEGGHFGANYTDSASEGAGVLYHVGVDWAWRINNNNRSIGVPIYANESGYVTRVNEGKANFLSILVKDSNGDEDYYLDYAHLSRATVTKDEDRTKLIPKGTLIGYAGKVGTKGAHLHIAKRYATEQKASDAGFDDLSSNIKHSGNVSDWSSLDKTVLDDAEIGSNNYLSYIDQEKGNLSKETYYVEPPEPYVK